MADVLRPAYPKGAARGQGFARLRGFFLWVLLMVLLWPFAAMAGAGADEQPERVTQAVRSVYDQGRLVDRALVTFPDRLSHDWNRDGLRLVYDITLPAHGHHDPRALWLMRAGAPYQLKANGTALTPLLPQRDDGWSPWRDAASPTLNGRSPALFRLPAGARSVELTLQAPPFMPFGLVELREGPVQALIRHHLDRYAVLALPVQVSQVLALSVGLFALLLWSLRRHEWPLLTFGCMALSLGLRETLYQVSVLPFPGPWFELSNPWFITHFVTAALALTLSLTGTMTRSRRTALCGAWGVMQLMFLAVGIGGSGVHGIRQFVVLLGNVSLVAIVWMLLRHRGVLPTGRAWILLSGFLVMLAGSVHDLGMAMGWVSPDQGTWIAWGFSGLVAAYGMVTADHVLLQLEQARVTRALLAQRLDAFSEELVRSLDAVAQTEQEQARRQERQHVMRDLHDTLGARLITALRGVERQELDRSSLATLLRESIGDLGRLNGAPDGGGPVGPALQQWWQTWSPHLTRAGMRLIWALGGETDQLVATAPVLDMLRRFLQEGAANALKHARASQMWVSCTAEAATLVLVIEDDGLGLNAKGPLHHQGNGMGLSGMQARARALGAQLETGNSPRTGGARLALRVPLTQLASTGQAQARGLQGGFGP